MNPRLDLLHPYPFERLNALKAEVRPPTGLEHIPLSIGEPRHPAPEFVVRHLADSASQVAGLGAYPATRGSESLRQAISDWLTRRFALPAGSLPASAVLPVNGTREALFAVAQALVDSERPGGERPSVLLPNPFYQIYEGAALLAGADPVYVACPRSHGFLPALEQISVQDLDRCQLCYICSPGNPTGAVMSVADWRAVLELADRHDFVIAADECYSELYADEASPPVGLLQACAKLGRTDYRRCLVFHSLSKRSSLPGLRSGFVAGDAGLIERFLRYRTYHGCAMPAHVQAASALAWSDEAHVIANRQAYRQKFDAVLEILGDRLQLERPPAGFYLWPRTPVDDETFTRELFRAEHVTVLPGRYLSRPQGDADPGRGHVRMALVAPLAQCVEAAERIRRFLDR